MDHQVTKINTFLSDFEDEELVALMRRNIDFFALALSNMPGIDTIVVFHHLAIDSMVKPVSQRKHKVGEEKMATINEEVEMLKSVDFITKVKYPSLMDNIVLVHKSSNK